MSYIAASAYQIKIFTPIFKITPVRLHFYSKPSNTWLYMQRDLHPKSQVK